MPAAGRGITEAHATERVFDRLVQLARNRSYFFSDIWERSRDQFGPTWAAEVVENVTRLFGPEENGRWEQAVQGYAEFALDAMRNQKFFEAHGRYRYQSLADIEGRFYRSEQHMMRNYLPGMFLSHYLWPHHFRMLTFFRTEVLPALNPAPKLFHDVGIGTGMYSRETLRSLPQVRGKGFDISEYSVTFTRDLLGAFGLLDRFEFVLGNVYTTELPLGTADFVVSQECLEHLEEPEGFCRILFELAKAGGRAYITAAINAGHSDHIYLFRSPPEVRAMLERVGWTVLKWNAEYAYADRPIQVTPCVAGFLCARVD